MKRILVTGAAGFIGYYVSKLLLERGDEVVGIDNINDYYSVDLKYGRLGELGVDPSRIMWNISSESSLYPNFKFIRMDIEHKQQLDKLFKTYKFDYVCHLAAQAGVRYSIENPYAYIQSNIFGFTNILECCRNYPVRHLVYASSSSVYGLNTNYPFCEQDSIAHPASLYAATKKSNELMAHTYSHLYNIPTTGLRLFTVYGAWGRPDMSPFIFTDAILRDRPIKVNNQGDMYRDFTYIDDITEAIVRLIDRPAQIDTKWDSSSHNPASSCAPYRIYNIGNSSPVKLTDYIEAIETACKKRAIKELEAMQSGDVYKTYADTTALEKQIGYKPSTDLNKGVQKTVNWYKSYYNL